MARAWERVRGQRAVMLTTYRRDGRGVATPVGYGIDGETLYFMTDATTHKVARLTHTAEVAVAASTLRGSVTGPSVAGVAHEVTGPTADRARSVITHHNRVAWFFLLRRARRQNRTWRYYAVREAPALTTPQESA